MLRPALLAAALALTAPAAFADDPAFAVGALTIAQPYAHATPPNAPVGGAYMLIENAGERDDRLVSAASPLGLVEIHEMTNEDGVMRMSELEDGIVIPAGGAVELRRGGLHVMFLGLEAPFEDGAAVPLTLRFERAGAVEVEVTVTPRDSLPDYAKAGGHTRGQAGGHGAAHGDGHGQGD